MNANAAWKALALLVSIPKVTDWLIEKAQKTPYFHLPGYMERWWLLNGYGFDIDETEKTRHERKILWLPSVRIHHILRADDARDMHDHPWNARTVILKGWYVERRLMPDGTVKQFKRVAGDTAKLNYGEFHSIDEVSEGGVFTMFMTWDYLGTWGFLVDGVKIPWRKYTNEGAA